MAVHNLFCTIRGDSDDLPRLGDIPIAGAADDDLFSCHRYHVATGLVRGSGARCRGRRLQARGWSIGLASCGSLFCLRTAAQPSIEASHHEPGLDYWSARSDDDWRRARAVGLPLRKLPDRSQKRECGKARRWRRAICNDQGIFGERGQPIAASTIGRCAWSERRSQPKVGPIAQHTRDPFRHEMVGDQGNC